MQNLKAESYMTEEPSIASDLAMVLAKGLGPTVRRLIENRVASERERCAQIAEDTPDSPPYESGAMRHLIAQRIRECADGE
jgi:hypothetical protein